MQTAIELNQGADGLPAFSFLAAGTLLARARPDQGLTEPARSGLPRDTDAVVAEEFLGKQCWPMIGILLTIQTDAFRSHFGGKGFVGGSSA